MLSRSLTQLNTLFFFGEKFIRVFIDFNGIERLKKRSGNFSESEFIDSLWKKFFLFSHFRTKPRERESRNKSSSAPETGQKVWNGKLNQFMTKEVITFNMRRTFSRCLLVSSCAPFDCTHNEFKMNSTLINCLYNDGEPWGSSSSTDKVGIETL